MKQTILPLLAILLLTFSCGLIRKYPDNEVVQFARCLNDSEKAILNTGKIVYKEWDGVDNNGGFARGLLQIRVDSFRPNRYLFIKNGEWNEEHKAVGGKYLKINGLYDRFGNKIIERTYIRTKESSPEFIKLFEEGTDSINATSYFKRFYDNGQIKYVYYYKSLNPKDYISEYFKGFKLDSAKAFKPDGSAIDLKEIDTYDMLYYKPTKCK